MRGPLCLAAVALCLAAVAWRADAATNIGLCKEFAGSEVISTFATGSDKGMILWDESVFSNTDGNDNNEDVTVSYKQAGPGRESRTDSAIIGAGVVVTHQSTHYSNPGDIGSGVVFMQASDADPPFIDHVAVGPGDIPGSNFLNSWFARGKKWRSSMVTEDGDDVTAALLNLWAPDGEIVRDFVNKKCYIRGTTQGADTSFETFQAGSDCIADNTGNWKTLGAPAAAWPAGVDVVYSDDQTKQVHVFVRDTALGQGVEADQLIGVHSMPDIQVIGDWDTWWSNNKVSYEDIHVGTLDHAPVAIAAACHPDAPVDKAYFLGVMRVDDATYYAAQFIWDFALNTWEQPFARISANFAYAPELSLGFDTSSLFDFDPAGKRWVLCTTSGDCRTGVYNGTPDAAAEVTVFKVPKLWRSGGILGFISGGATDTSYPINSVLFMWPSPDQTALWASLFALFLLALIGGAVAATIYAKKRQANAANALKSGGVKSSLGLGDDA